MYICCVSTRSDLWEKRYVKQNIDFIFCVKYGIINYYTRNYTLWTTHMQEVYYTPQCLDIYDRCNFNITAII